MVDEGRRVKGLDIFSVLKFLLGIAVIIIGIFLSKYFFSALKFVFLACIGPFLVLVGLIMVAAAKE